MCHLIEPILDHHHHPSREGGALPVEECSSQSGCLIPGRSLHNHMSCYFPMWRCAQGGACQPLLCPTLSKIQNQVLKPLCEVSLM